MFRGEIGRSLRRLRLWLLAALAVSVAVLPTLVLKLSPDASNGGGVFDQVRHTGLVAPLFALFLIQGFFLPLAVGLLAGDAVAGEASSGMLRYLLIRPVGRVWLLL